MAAPSGRRNGGGGASLWAALLLAAVALRPAETVSEPTTVAFDVRPGGVVHSFSQNVGPGNKYTCVFTYASQGGTNETIGNTALLPEESMALCPITTVLEIQAAWEPLCVCLSGTWPSRQAGSESISSPRTQDSTVKWAQSPWTLLLTFEKWQMSLGTSEDHQHFTCTIWRPQGKSYLYFTQFKAEVRGAEIEYGMAYSKAAFERESEVPLKSEEFEVTKTAVSHRPGAFKAELSKLVIVAKVTRSEL
uniref:Myeloid derived growth factor n=1 Tax=Sus scrofa TaxID=9823 RepID=A0A8D1HY19_PIG